MTMIEPEVVEAQRFAAILTVEGVQTGDHRYIKPGALDWRDLPLTLMLQKSTPQGGMGGNPHAGAIAAGRILTIERVEQADGTVQIIGTGEFDAGTDGQEAARMVGDGTIRGVSVDLTNVTAEPECLEEGPDGDCVDGRDVFSQGRIMGATITPFQAIEPATISLAASMWVPGADVWLTDETGEKLAAVQLAAVAPVTRTPTGPTLLRADDEIPPIEWFGEQSFTKPQPLAIEGRRIFGHLAQWGVCHMGFVNQVFNKCVTVPSSKTGYALFAKPGAQLARCCGECEPQEVTAGSIIMDTIHADISMPWKYANEFYANTGKVAAHVAMGEDEIGPWFSGQLNPTLDSDQIWVLRGAKVSGDWRKYGQGLELTTILAVNVPGFPVVPPKVGFAEDGTVMALVASLSPEQDTAAAPGPSWLDFMALKNELDSLRAEQAESAAVSAAFIDEAVDRYEQAMWGSLNPNM